jgi:hypothetical protein
MSGKYRVLNFEDVKALLKDPWHTLLVEVLSAETYITTFGQGVYDITEQVMLDDEADEQLRNLENDGVIYYGRLNDLSETLPLAHFFDAWREDAYGAQQDEAYVKAVELGIQCNPDGYREV